jgi:hypothetical protein
MTAIETSGVTIASTDPITSKKDTKSAAHSTAIEDADKTETAAALGTTEESERNSVFENLVKGDTDVVGLVAYSIYKQNKHDWLVALRRQRGREPTDVELAAYIIGEGTARRLVTYRHLAEATIEGRGPEITFSPGGDSRARPPIRAISRTAPPGLPVWAFVALAAVAAVLIVLAARFGIPGITPAG